MAKTKKNRNEEQFFNAIDKRIRFNPQVQKIEVSKIEPNPSNRKYFSLGNEEDFETLKETMDRNGLLNPILVRPSTEEKGKYVILGGERRWTAANSLGWKKIDARVVTSKLTSELEETLIIIDNVERRQLKPQERVKIYRTLYKNFDMRIGFETSGRKPSKAKEKSYALSAKQISQETGIPIGQVKADLTKLRKANNTSKDKLTPAEYTYNSIVVALNAVERKLKEIDYVSLVDVERKLEKLQSKVKTRQKAEKQKYKKLMKQGTQESD